MSDLIIHYIERVTPGVIAFAALLYLIPERLRILRLFIFILVFMFLRDTMTPEGLWTITSTFEVRFVNSPITLYFLTFASIAIVILSHFSIGNLLNRRLWITHSPFTTVVLGSISAIAIALIPLIYRLVIKAPPSPIPQGMGLIGAIFCMTMVGNLLEEVLFRGHFQNYLMENKLSKTQIILISGLMFSVGHTFLAFTVTNVGWPILVFTFYEGTICAFLRSREGLLASVLAHGGGLFLISSGLV